MIILILIAMVVVFIFLNNSIISSKNAVEKSSANIDVYLQQRLDLMENLFSTMERGLDYESSVLENIAELRSQLGAIKNGYNNSDASSVVKTDKAVNGLMADFKAIQENYPQMKGLETVQLVMSENAKVEKEIASARRSYNTNVTEYKKVLQMFPTSVVAKMKRYTDDYELYVADEQARTRVKPMFEDHYKEKYASKKD